MVCIEEVFIWFKELKNSFRIELICGLFNLCTPHELRFFGTILEDLGRKDFHYLWENDQKANTESELLKLTNINDPIVRSQLIVSLVLLRSSNRLAATKIFNILVEELQMEKFVLPGFLSDEKCLNEVVLLLALAARHPAFSFEQKNILSQRLIMLEKLSLHSRSEFSTPSQDIAIYNSSNMLWSSFNPVLPSSNLPEPAELDSLVPVLSMYPALSTDVSAIPNAYITTCPQHLPNAAALNVVDSYRVQVTGLEFGGLDKNRTYRIRVLWSNGKQTDVLRSYQEISVFHQKLLLSLSHGTQVSHSESIIPPFQPCNGHNNSNGHENIPENNKIQLMEYFRQLSLILHTLDQDLIASFFQPNPKVSQIVDSIGRIRSPAPPAPLLYQHSHSSSQYQAPNQLPDPVGIIQPLSSLPSNLLSSETRISPTRPSVPSLSPTTSPLSSPISSPLVSPPASETSSRSASPWQQQLSSQLSQQLQLQPNSTPNHPPPHKSTRAMRVKTGTYKDLANQNNTVETLSKTGNVKPFLLAARLGKYAEKLQYFDINELLKMSVEDLEKAGLAKAIATKVKKKLESFKINPPNGAAANFHLQYSKNNYHSNSSQIGYQPTSTPAPVYPNPPASRPRSESSPSCSDYSSPPPSPPLSEGSNGQGGIQLRSQTNSSSEENLNDQGSSMKTNSVHIPPLSSYNMAINSCIISKHSMDSHVPIVTTAPMHNHPFKPHMLSLHCRSSTGSPHYATQLPFDGRLLPMNPSLHIMANSGVPPPGLARPAHLSPGGMNSQQSDRGVQSCIAGILNYGPAMNPSCTTAPTSRTVIRNNNNSSCTTVSSIHNNSSHRYTPPKVHQIEKNSYILPSQQQQGNHQLPEFLPPMMFTQPPPPVPSSTSGVVPISISNCLSNCNCTNSVSGPMVSPAIHPQVPSTNNGGPQATLPYTVGFLPHMFQHPLQFMTSHSGATPNNYISPGLPTHFTYAVPNGMAAHNLGPELVYTGHSFQLTAPSVVTTLSGGIASAPAVQQGVTTMVSPGMTGAGSQFLPFPGKCPFPQLPAGTIAPQKIPSCHNCGGQGHKGQDCKDNTSEDNLPKTNQFRINYNSSNKQPVDSHD